MNSDNKQIRDVADVAARIMYGQQPVTEKLHPNQQKLDVHEPEKDELTADDFKKLRAKKEVKKEEVEQIDELSKETLGSYLDKKKSEYMKGKTQSGSKKNAKDIQNMGKAHDKMKKEEVESIDEVKMADLPSTKVQGRAYGASKPEPHPIDVMKGPTEKQLLGVQAEKKKKKFSEMVDNYNNDGLKSFMKFIRDDELIDEISKDIADYTMDVIDAGEYTEVTIGEEASQKEFNTEIEKAKAKSQGKVKVEVAKGAVQAVKQEGTEITDEMIFEVLENAGIDFESLSDDELQVVANEAYEILDELSKGTLKSYVSAAQQDNKDHADSRRSGDKDEAKYAKDRMIKRSTGIGAAKNRLYKEEVELEEREMTDAEMKKREDIVKGMKKGMAGFKERYGDRAKNVMYATANKQAMKD